MHIKNQSNNFDWLEKGKPGWRPDCKANSWSWSWWRAQSLGEKRAHLKWNEGVLAPRPPGGRGGTGPRRAGERPGAAIKMQCRCTERIIELQRSATLRAHMHAQHANRARSLCGDVPRAPCAGAPCGETGMWWSFTGSETLRREKMGALTAVQQEDVRL